MKIRLAIFLILLSSFILDAQAGSATWNASPTSGDWNTATNWTPATVPNGPSDVATFASSTTTAISISSATEVNGITYNSGGSSFNITPNGNVVLTISGVGITSQSAVIQKFSTSTKDPNSEVRFTNSASAGSSASFTANINGKTTFFGTASAGDATFVSRANVKSFVGDIGGLTEFFDNSTAANATFTNDGGLSSNAPASTFFEDNSTAGTATITNNPALPGGLDGSGGETSFFGNASADHATITNLGSSGVFSGQTYFADNATAANATFVNQGGVTTFADSATAANATFTNEVGGGIENIGGTLGDAFVTNNGGDGSNGLASHTDFFFDASAGNSTIIANGGTNGGPGSAIYFFNGGNNDGGTSRMELFGNGKLDISDHNSPGITTGSIEGDGLVFLGHNNLTVGSNNLRTSFSGTISGNPGGSLTKIGTGSLTLTGANTYTGGTTVNGGTLLVSNPTGSGLGTGPVQALSGILGGNGIISGRVTMGTGHGTGVVLGPGANSVVPGTLTIAKQLAFKSDATYRVTVNSRTASVDQVIANGIRILEAQIVFNEVASATLPPGTTFTVISNTSSKPISGTFANLPDGGSITVGSNTYQANYEGGDGNDLTLTVVQ